MDKRLEELQKKISFIYELDGKLYAIGHYKVFDCTYSKVVAPDFVRLFSVYKANIESTYEELCKNKTAEIMFKLWSFSNNEVQEEYNKEHIISVEAFWDRLTNEQKNIIEKQIDEFVDMFMKADMKTKYPGIH